MSFIPKQNWPAYRSLVESQSIKSSRSAMEIHRRYVEIYNYIRSRKPEGEPLRSPEQLQEKLKLRAKLLVAYRLVKFPSKG